MPNILYLRFDICLLFSFSISFILPQLHYSSYSCYTIILLLLLQFFFFFLLTLLSPRGSLWAQARPLALGPTRAAAAATPRARWLPVESGATRRPRAYIYIYIDMYI